MNAYILAGGFSRRFGRDKTLFEIEGKPLILSIYEKVSQYFPTFVVAKDVEKYRWVGIEKVIPDRFPEIQSPLVGIITGLEHSPYEKNLFLSADLPLLCDNFLRFVRNEEHTKGDFYGFVPQLGGKYHFTCSVYTKRFLPAAVEAVGKGLLSLKRFLPHFRIWEEELLKTAGVSDNCCFNLNRPSDWETLREVLKGGNS